MNKDSILSRVDNLLKDRGIEVDIYGEDVSVILGGSLASGLSTEQSDIDIRVVRLTGVEDLYGLGEVEHSKFAEGEGSVNSKGDLDIEVFTSRRLMKDLLHGEIVANEIIFSEDELILKDTVWFKEIRESRKLFSSKRFIFKSLSYYKGARHRAIPKSVGNIRSGYRKDRVLKYGYDTKNAERSIRVLQIIDEYVKTGKFEIKRDNALWLRKVREGLLTADEYLMCVEGKYKDLVSKVAEMELMKYGDRDKVNKFMVDFARKWCL